MDETNSKISEIIAWDLVYYVPILVAWRCTPLFVGLTQLFGTSLYRRLAFRMIFFSTKYLQNLKKEILSSLGPYNFTWNEHLMM